MASSPTTLHRAAPSEAILAALPTLTPADVVGKIEQRVRLIREQDTYSKQVGHASQLGFLVEQHAEAIVKALTAEPDLLAALIALRDFGCPACSGDCGSANPPVISCPMQQASAAIAQGTAS